MQLQPQRLRIYKIHENEASWPHDEGFTNPERVSQGTCSILDVWATSFLKRRKIIRHCRKKKHGKNLGKEGLTYKARGFWE